MNYNLAPSQVIVVPMLTVFPGLSLIFIYMHFGTGTVSSPLCCCGRYFTMATASEWNCEMATRYPAPFGCSNQKSTYSEQCTDLARWDLHNLWLTKSNSRGLIDHLLLSPARFCKNWREFFRRTTTHGCVWLGWIAALSWICPCIMSEFGRLLNVQGELGT